MPRKRDLKGWENLRLFFHGRRRKILQEGMLSQVRRVHALEQEIQALEARVASVGQRKKMAELKACLARAREMPLVPTMDAWNG